ncbi:MarR family winged helix-turn-helix transcriptional regulator [Hyphococcus luteus]|uniref:MarR family transcriptional regulator n=1 Tax=Hyphococcus luteus TaxID=2058213 RepID=A0A2S7K0M8_9PROT|nr:MarR family transcriptional regulator [Marinicaulis flavus]PQA86075.1 MarR family transcriptional regulator [Marinicaulis flavus]
MSKTTTAKPPTRARDAHPPEPLDVLHRLLKLVNRLNAPFSEHLEKRFRVTMNEFRVIMLIGRLGTAASHEIADMSGVTTMSVSRAVTSLERKGWIACRVDDENRRRKILRLTREGEKLYKQMLPTADRVATYLFTSLRPEEILAFDHYVATLTESLEARDEEGRSIFLEETRPDA